MADRNARRGLRDEAGVGPNPNDARRLVPLKELDDFRVADGEPDIRGWNVYTATGREIGDIEDLLVDTVERELAGEGRGEGRRIFHREPVEDGVGTRAREPLRHFQRF